MLHDGKKFEWIWSLVNLTSCPLLSINRKWSGHSSKKKRKWSRPITSIKTRYRFSQWSSTISLNKKIYKQCLHAVKIELSLFIYLKFSQKIEVVNIKQYYSYMRMRKLYTNFHWVFLHVKYAMLLVQAINLFSSFAKFHQPELVPDHPSVFQTTWVWNGISPAFR